MEILAYSLLKERGRRMGSHFPEVVERKKNNETLQISQEIQWWNGYSKFYLLKRCQRNCTEFRTKKSFERFKSAEKTVDEDKHKDIIILYSMLKVP